MLPYGLRYSRLLALRRIGPKGMKALRRSTVAVVGCGALGSNVAILLAISGIGGLKLIDRDVVNITDLPRQPYTERQDELGIPKAIALKERIEELRSDLEMEPIVESLDDRNARRLLEDVDLVVDGTDNLESRFAINEACAMLEKPAVFGAAIETYGWVMPFIPHRTACLKEVFSAVSVSEIASCEEVGVLGSLTSLIASLQASQALRIIVEGAVESKLVFVDAWRMDFEEIQIPKQMDCPFHGSRPTRSLGIAGDII